LVEIRARLHSSADRTYNVGDVVRTAGPVLNVRVPVIRTIVADYATRCGSSLDDAIRLMDEATRTRVREELLFGVFLLARFKKQFSRGLWDHADRWVESVDNWETCDQLAMNVIGELVARHLNLSKELVVWSRAANPWRRRSAVAATTALNQKGRSHPTQTFDVCEGLLEDPDTMVQKAVAWALREVARSNTRAVVQFLRARQGHVSSFIVRDVSRAVDRR
jgi:3-methyladenine DNA glycosylase AlkD